MKSAPQSRQFSFEKCLLFCIRYFAFCVYISKAWKPKTNYERMQNLWKRPFLRSRSCWSQLPLFLRAVLPKEILSWSAPKELRLPTLTNLKKQQSCPPHWPRKKSRNSTQYSNRLRQRWNCSKSTCYHKNHKGYFGKCKSRQHGNGFAAEMCG